MRKVLGFGSLDTNVTVQEGSKTTPVLPTGKQGWICKGNRSQEIRTSLSSGVSYIWHISLCHSSQSCLGSILMFLVMPLKKKKSPHRIAVEPRDWWVLISLAIKVLKPTSDVLGSVIFPKTAWPASQGEVYCTLESLPAAPAALPPEHKHPQASTELLLPGDTMYKPHQITPNLQK